VVIPESPGGSEKFLDSLGRLEASLLLQVDVLFVSLLLPL